MKLLIDYALSFVGTPYKWGGDDFSGFDCSGFVQEILAAAGIDPPGDQTAEGLYDYFDSYGMRLKTPVAGALCFYGKSEYDITHVAFSVNHNLVLEASGGGSKTKTVKDAIRDNAYIRMRPYNKRSDFIAIILPSYPL